MTDSGNNVVWEGVYKPFGEADVNPNSTVVNNFRFPGQYYDQETGLHYNYHRYYDPKVGRYLTPDPIGLDGGINLFTYVEDNPINEIDPFGLSKWYPVPGKPGWEVRRDQPHHGKDYYHEHYKKRGKTLSYTFTKFWIKSSNVAGDDI